MDRKVSRSISSYLSSTAAGDHSQPDVAHQQCRDLMAVLAILGVASGAHGGFPLIQRLSDSRLLVLLVMGSTLWLRAVHPDPHPWL
jgi:hypothetical protein